MSVLPNFEANEKQNTEAHAYAVKSGVSGSIIVGDVVIEDTANPGFVKAVGTAEVTDNDVIVGMASTTSTETTTVDGAVLVNDELATQVFKGNTVGTPTQAQVNSTVTITSNADGTQRVNEDSTTGGIAKIIAFNATNKTVDFKILNKKGAVASAARLDFVQQTVLFSEFTDGGSTSGTFVLNDVIPVGALVTQSLIDDITGFTGDTSAVVTIGDGSDVDRYNTGTPDVFPTATAVAAGAVSGTALHTTVANVTLTVTSATDFSAVNAGQVTVTIFFYVAE